MMESQFTNDMNVSAISRRRILANIDYEIDGFMCSTLIKDVKENDDKKSNTKFYTDQDIDEIDRLTGDVQIDVKMMNQNKELVDQINRLSNQKQDSIKRTMKNFDFIQKDVNKRSTKKSENDEHQSLMIRNRSSIRQMDDESMIYDSQKAFSDLSSIEKIKLDNLRNNLKNMQMNSIDKRRILTKYFNDYTNGSAKMNRDRLIEHENLQSELYNTENSEFIDQIKKIQNYHNNQIVHPQINSSNDEETWFCKTKLYDDTLDEIVNKW